LSPGENQDGCGYSPGYSEFDWYPAEQLDGYELSERFETEQLPLETSCITVEEAQRQCDLNDECEAFSYSSLGAILYKPPTVKVSASNNVVSTTWEQRVTFAKKRLSSIFVKHKGKLPAGATSLGSLTGSLSSCENACGDGQCIGFTRPAGAMPSQEVACDLYGPFYTFDHKDVSLCGTPAKPPALSDL